MMVGGFDPKSPRLGPFLFKYLLRVTVAFSKLSHSLRPSRHFSNYTQFPQFESSVVPTAMIISLPNKMINQVKLLRVTQNPKLISHTPRKIIYSLFFRAWDLKLEWVIL